MKTKEGPPAAAEERTWMTQAEAAEHMRVSVRTLERLVKRGLIRRARVTPGVRTRGIRYSRRELDSYLEGRLRRER